MSARGLMLPLGLPHGNVALRGVPAGYVAPRVPLPLKPVKSMDPEAKKVRQIYVREFKRAAVRTAPPEIQSAIRLLKSHEFNVSIKRQAPKLSQEHKDKLAAARVSHRKYNNEAERIAGRRAAAKARYAEKKKVRALPPDMEETFAEMARVMRGGL